MRTSIKPSLLILFTFILGMIGIVLPGTKIQYQIITKVSQSGTESPMVTSAQGLASVFGDKYGRDAFSCEFARLETLPNSIFVNRLAIWQYIGRMLSIAAMLLVLVYNVRRKISLIKFLGLMVVIFGGMPILFWAVSPKTVEVCNSNDLYRVLAFTPNWSAVLVLGAAILLGYFANREDLNNSNRSSLDRVPSSSSSA